MERTVSDHMPTYRIEEEEEEESDDVFTPASLPSPLYSTSTTKAEALVGSSGESLSDIAKKIQKPNNSNSKPPARRQVGGQQSAPSLASSSSSSRRSQATQQLRTVHSGRSFASTDSGGSVIVMTSDGSMPRGGNLASANSRPRGAPSGGPRPQQRRPAPVTMGGPKAPPPQSTGGTGPTARMNQPKAAATAAAVGLERTATAPLSQQQAANNNRRENMLKTRLKSRKATIKNRINNNDNLPSSLTSGNPSSSLSSHRPAGSRRYKPGDKVLVCNQQSRWSTLVNRFGFPPGEGSSPEELRGPYIFSLATVKQVHFEEFAAYYTVVRADTGAEQRADADFMEPIRTKRGEQAAARAALQSSLDAGGTGGGDYDLGSDAERFASEDEIAGGRRNKILSCLEYLCFLLLLPFLWIFDYLYCIVVTCCAPVASMMMTHARLILHGLEPYACQLRITIVNLIVLCSFWYMFIDQARLAFFPPRSDHAVAVMNFIIWLVLLAELAFEVFIRPQGYQSLIVSEKAFSPATVRYMNAAHLFVELFCLAMFVPEFVCIFIGKSSCSDRFSFSFFNAALMSITGPTRIKAFYGRAYFALVRLRVFGVVRHWKNMWITSMLLVGGGHRRRQDGFLSSVFPRMGRSRGDTGKRLQQLEQQPAPTSAPSQEFTPADGLDEEPSQKTNQHAALTNASNIGTALMVTNSYRAIALLWFITGVFPIFTFAINSLLINGVATTMTEQLQATNLISDDTSAETCDFFTESVYSWVQAVVAPDVADDLEDPYLVDMQILPERCNLSIASLCLDIATQFSSLPHAKSLCESRATLVGQSSEEQAETLGVRVGALVEYSDSDLGSLLIVDETGATSGNLTETVFSVWSQFDQTYSIQTAALGSLLLQVCLLFLVLGGLSLLRRDAEVLVLGPLRLMLKIVASYAKNPLITPRLGRGMRSSRRGRSQRDEDSFSSTSEDDSSDGGSSRGHGGSGDGGDWQSDQFALGRFETEQLIAAVTKITDLLRKCWGVAGADIISTNLATKEGALEVFNPTVPGKSVYALFAFAAINDFDHALRNLGGDVMILINDVASVLHGEVFRWGLADSGECNKNLGGAFLMVFRIGLVKEVVKKLKTATDVIFTNSKPSKASQALTRRRANKLQQQQQQTVVVSGHQRRGSTNTTHSAGSNSTPGTAASTGASSAGASSSARPSRSDSNATGRPGSPPPRRLNKVQRSASVKAMSLSLASLPGIGAFTDRAVIGVLKAFAGIHRDHKLRSWKNDFRLGAGVGAFTVSMIFGMDAGWAVEGAVGSEYKIDATYLSPHVNMASRMMSACKQYGVTILLSQAVQELMSDVARSKLRHLDTVTVKGSSVKQKIFTYDARHKGADFFLFSRTDDQADAEADRYVPNTWNTDSDLNAMRQHVTDEFLHEFEEGRKMFLLGEWSVARRRLQKANDLMVENAIEGGYLEAELESIMDEVDGSTEAAADELKRINGDGPSQYLLNFMESYDNVPPALWEGWHPLTRK